MKEWMKILVFVLVLVGAASQSFAKKVRPNKNLEKKRPQEFKFYKELSKSGPNLASYYLELDGRKIFLTLSQENNQLEVVNINQTVPAKVLEKARILHFLKERYPSTSGASGAIALEKMIRASYFKGIGLNYFELIDFVYNVCFLNKDLKCLSEVLVLTERFDLVEYSNFKAPKDFLKLRARIKRRSILQSGIAMSMAELSKSWKESIILLRDALAFFPDNFTAQEMAIRLSLKIGLKVLSYYEDEILENGFKTAISFSQKVDGEFEYGEFLKEFIANTYNTTRLITSSLGIDPFVADIIQNRSDVLAVLANYKKQMVNILLLKEKSSNLLSFKELIAEHITGDFRHSEFIGEILERGIYPFYEEEGGDKNIYFPALDQFEIPKIHQFVAPEIGQVLLEQINLLNIVMLVKGPALLRHLGRTKAGVILQNKMHLGKVSAQIAGLRWPFNSLFMWLAIETADGCIVRYAYALYTVGEKISGEEKNLLEESL